MVMCYGSINSCRGIIRASAFMASQPPRLPEMKKSPFLLVNGLENKAVTDLGSDIMNHRLYVANIIIYD